ncbi:neuropeptide CCHamide-1 receptor-like [Antedon mediterranea]|uniref:neuropeptide CCHamide-1 receptor-like n=1 Tax=Antedon mediterranea TaxID=105859 RepID=UPI003AF4F4D5
MYNTTEFDSSYTAPTLEIILIIPDILVLVIGVIGNGTLCVIILANQSMRTRHNTLICNLAVADLFFLLFNIPFKAIHTIIPGFLNNLAACKVMNSVMVLTLAVSSLSIAALSAERYFASATARNTTMTALKIKKIVVPIIWVSAIISTIPILISAKMESHMGESFCEMVPVGTLYGIGYEVCIAILLIIVPLIVTLAFYLSMARKLVRDYSEMSAVGPSSREENSVHHDSVSRQRRERGRKSLALTVVVIAILFGICWIPTYIYKIFYQTVIYTSNVKILLWSGLHPLGQFLQVFSHINSCVNPIVLYIRSRTYHGYFNKYLCYCYSKAKRYKKQPVTS